MKPKAREYLDLLQRAPGTSREKLAAAVGVAPDTPLNWRKVDPEFRDEEEGLRLVYKAQQQRAKAAERFVVVEAGKLEEEEAAAPEPEPIPPALLRWLELFEETGKRVEALRLVREEGVTLDGRTLTFEDVEAADARYPEFHRRFWAAWRMTTLEAEDHLRADARNPKARGEARLAVLRAEMPEKYGAKVKHEHSGKVQLEAAHEGRLKEVQEGWLRRRQVAAAREELKALTAPQEDVIEGEVL